MTITLLSDQNCMRSDRNPCTFKKVPNVSLESSPHPLIPLLTTHIYLPSGIVWVEAVLPLRASSQTRYCVVHTGCVVAGDTQMITWWRLSSWYELFSQLLLPLLLLLLLSCFHDPSQSSSSSTLNNLHDHHLSFHIICRIDHSFHS